MGIINSNRAHTGFVEKYIGTAYDVVKLVSDNMHLIEMVSELDLEYLAQVAKDIEFWYEETGKSASAAKASEDAAKVHADNCATAVGVVNGHLATIEAAVTTAEQAVTDAQSAATLSEAQKDFAKEWASTATDTPISSAAGGDGNTYSSLHYATKSAEFHTKIVALDATYAQYLSDTEDARDAAQTAQGAAETAETNAETSEINAKAALDDFLSRYIGKFDTPPVEDPANPFAQGAIYFSTVYPEMFYAWSVDKWVAAYSRLDEKDYLKVDDHAKITNNPHGVQLSDVDIDGGIAGKLAHWIALDDIPANEPTISAFIKAVLTSEVPDIDDMNAHLVATGNVHDMVFSELFRDAGLPTMDYFSDIPLSTTQASAVAAKIKQLVLDTKGANYGIAPLDFNGEIPAQYLPPSASVVNFIGGWNPTTTLSPTAKSGDFYIVEQAGTITLSVTVLMPGRTTGTVNLNIGDWIIYNGTAWSVVQMPVNPPYDDLNGTDKTLALAATQGKRLKDMIDALLPPQLPGALLSDGAGLSWQAVERALGIPPNATGYLQSTHGGARSWVEIIPAAQVSPLIPNDVPIGVEWIDDVSGKAYVCFREKDTTPGSLAPAVWITR